MITSPLRRCQFLTSQSPILVYIPLVEHHEATLEYVNNVQNSLANLESVFQQIQPTSGSKLALCFRSKLRAEHHTTASYHIAAQQSMLVPFDAIKLHS
jgi:hypothetical protein